MMTKEQTIISGDKNLTFKLLTQFSGVSSFMFKVLNAGKETDKTVSVNIYGAITAPADISLSHEERNRLSAAAIREYKRGYHF